MYINKVINQNNEGYGIVKNNDKVVFIPYSLTGDVIDYDIIKENKKYDMGKIINIINESNERTKPICKYYYECGGCNLMHQKYKYQLEFKVNKVINNLKHISNINIDNIDIIYDNSFNYRNHITLSVKKDVIGFYKNNSNEIIDIDYCYISNDKTNNVLKEIRLFLNKYKNNYIDKISIKVFDEVLINISSNDFNLINEFKRFVNFDSLYINDKYVLGKKYIIAKLNDYKYKVSSKDFFQKNTNMTIKLYDYIKELVNNNETVLDLYCGSGGIGIYISDKVKSVIGIEVIKESIDNALENALLNNINNIKFICGKVENNINNIKNIDTIIVDPPRVGLNKNAIKDILKINSNKIIYVSCNSTTLARDINLLKEYYSIECIKLFDLFPNTEHIETVILLQKLEKNKY